MLFLTLLVAFEASNNKWYTIWPHSRPSGHTQMGTTSAPFGTGP